MKQTAHRAGAAHHGQRAEHQRGDSPGDRVVTQQPDRAGDEQLPEGRMIVPVRTAGEVVAGILHEVPLVEQQRGREREVVHAQDRARDDQ